MSDGQTPSAGEETPTPATGDGQTPDGDKPLGEAGEKALQAERDRAKAAERTARDLQRQLEEATSRATAAETARTETEGRLTAAELRAVRIEVAYETGLPQALADRLRGDDAEALRADAEKLLQMVPSRTTPKPDPSQGARTPAPTTPKAAFAAALGPILNP